MEDQKNEELVEDSNSEDEGKEDNQNTDPASQAAADKKQKKKNKKQNQAKAETGNAEPGTTAPATTTPTSQQTEENQININQETTSQTTTKVETSGQQKPVAVPVNKTAEQQQTKQESSSKTEADKKKQKKNKGQKEQSDDQFLQQMIQENLKNQKEEVKESEKPIDSVTNSIPQNPIEIWCPSGTPILTAGRAQDNSELRLLGSWAAEAPGTVYLQTTPPTIPIDKQFPDRNYPQGEDMPYSKSYNVWRTSKSELQEKDQITEDQLVNLRKAAECHRQVRKHCQKIIRPGKRLIDVCNEIEEMNRYLVGENGLKAGIAFPTGCSKNNVAAHYTPNSGDFTTIDKDDVVKIDFGTQIEGRIIDSAFTVAFNPKFDPLLKAVKQATNTGIRSAGIDARLGEVGADIQEVMESYEVELDGQTYKVKSVTNLNGHSIDPYRIHAGKSVPIIQTNNNQKMQENEQYAIETFGSTGKGVVIEDMECSHYMKEFGFPRVNLQSQKAKELLKFIDINYSTLAFCRKWLDRAGMNNHIMPLKELCNSGIVNPYPPLCDVKWSYVAQYQHTLFLKPSGKEILSRGDDY